MLVLRILRFAWRWPGCHCGLNFHRTWQAKADRT